MTPRRTRPEAILGIDTQKTRLGLALVDMEGKALWADTVYLRRDAEWYVSIDEALALAHAASDTIGVQVTCVVVEIPAIPAAMKTDEKFNAGGVFHLSIKACYRHWPKVTVFKLQPASWKKLSIGHGHSNKEAIMAWVVDYLGAAHLLPGAKQEEDGSWNVRRASQDAADALGIACAGIAKLQQAE